MEILDFLFPFLFFSFFFFWVTREEKEVEKIYGFDIWWKLGFGKISVEEDLSRNLTMVPN